MMRRRPVVSAGRWLQPIPRFYFLRLFFRASSRFFFFPSSARKTSSISMIRQMSSSPKGWHPASDRIASMRNGRAFPPIVSHSAPWRLSTDQRSAACSEMMLRRSVREHSEQSTLPRFAHLQSSHVGRPPNCHTAHSFSFFLLPTGLLWLSCGFFRLEPWQTQGQPHRFP